MTNIERIAQLKEKNTLPREEMRVLYETLSQTDEEALYQAARDVREIHYGKEVYLRGLIEFTNYCKNDCLYCGIRCSNHALSRYRLSEKEILRCADQGYELGFRTIVLQGGEDLSYRCEDICRIVSAIKDKHPDCAITLSIGEKTHDEYQAYFDAGAERYLLRHETANNNHYAKLHPASMSGEHRKACLYDLKSIGYQIGCGIMVGAPYQTTDHILDDIAFMQDLVPHMIGIGPFIPHKDTPFKDMASGTLTDTLHLLAILRLLFPQVLLPATTALGTIHPTGREQGILAGANVVMPNLSPTEVRGKYLLYDGKICTGDEAAECRHCMEMRISRTGYQVIVSRGDYAALQKKAP